MRSLPFNKALGGLIIGILLIAAITGALWTPYNPLQLDLLAKLAPPSSKHWLGTDEFGRDVLSRLMAGAATSVWISLVTAAFAVTIGTAIGAFSGFVRGGVDRLIMGLIDALQAFPGILLALGLLTIMGSNKYGIIFALGIAYTPAVVRIVRGNVLSLREREFVAASRVMGNSEAFTMLRHVLPNCLAPLIVLATSMFGWAILAESALSYLGLGVPPPAPTWGNMLASSRNYMAQASWLSIYPGICISLTLLGINLLGDAIRDRLDPRMKGVR